MAKSEKSWYELQDAKRSSQGDYAPLIAEHGHCCGKSNGAIVRNADVDCGALCRGDDFCVFGDCHEFEEIQTTGKRYAAHRKVDEQSTKRSKKMMIKVQ